MSEIGVYEFSVSYQVSVEGLLCVPLWRVPGTPRCTKCLSLRRIIEMLGTKVFYKEGAPSVLTNMAWHMGRGWFFPTQVIEKEEEGKSVLSRLKVPCPQTWALSPGLHLPFLLLPPRINLFLLYSTQSEKLQHVYLSRQEPHSNHYQSTVTKLFNTSNQTNGSSVKEILWRE